MFNGLAQRLTRRPSLRPAPHIAPVAAFNERIWPDLAAAQAQSLVYQQSPWVYVAINRIAEAAALVPLRVQPAGAISATNTTLQPNLTGHPLEALFDAPNPYLSRFELFEQTVGWLELTGNAYWFLAGNSSGLPMQIWPLRPDRVTIVPDPVAYLRGYVYEIDGRRIPLDAAEVVHFRRWHPANDYYGLSALETARLAIAADRSMAEWNRNTFGQDNGVPAGIVNIKDFVSDSDFERIKREWRQSYGGPQRRTAFLRGGGIEWQNIGLSHQDLDFLKGREAHRDEILNIFGVPVGMLSENATEANATVAERLFVERTLWPKLVRIAQKIAQELLPFWPHPNDYTAAFDDIRPTDVQARLEEIRTAYPVLSINEIRGRFYSLPAVEWGHIPVGHSVGTTQFISSSSVPASPVAEPASPAPADPSPTDPSDSLKAALDELGRWERFTLKRHGRSHGRSFEVRNLPDELAFEISVGLLAAPTPDDQHAVFTAARATLEATLESSPSLNAS